MKKFFMFIVMLLSISLIIQGFVFAQEMMKEKPKGKTMAVKPSGAALWDHMKKMDYTKKWKMWPGKTAFYKGTEPHGAFLTTYVNGPALKAIKDKKGMLPVRAIVAKENYSPDKKLMAITVMYKVKDYNPAGGNWFWTKYSPDGKIEAEGKVEMCINCHSKKKDNDYIFSGPLK